MKAKATNANQRVELGEYIVADPEICHGKPTFKGTRVMVWVVLEQVARGMDWDAIVKEWRGRVPREAIGEAVRLAGGLFRTEYSPTLHVDPRRKFSGRPSLAAA
jgi:uncharacterized protein (DUF433 family)